MCRVVVPRPDLPRSSLQCLPCVRRSTTRYVREHPVQFTQTKVTFTLPSVRLPNIVSSLYYPSEIFLVRLTTHLFLVCVCFCLRLWSIDQLTVHSHCHRSCSFTIFTHLPQSQPYVTFLCRLSWTTTWPIPYLHFLSSVRTVDTISLEYDLLGCRGFKFVQCVKSDVYLWLTSQLSV